jgi:hypothetical protein
MTRKKRGSGLPNPDEGWCGRRIRKATRQAGSPDLSPLDICPIHSSGVVAEVARISYLMRKSRVPKRAYSGLRSVRRYLKLLAVRIVPPAVTTKGEVKTVPALPVVPQSDAKKPGLGYAPISFVSGGMLSDEVVEPLPYKPRYRPRPSGGVLRLRWPSGLPSDPRVAGTFLEGPAAKARRARMRPAPITVLGSARDGLVRERPPPQPKALISDLELNAAMATMKNPETDAFVELVKSQAPPDLAALLAGEDWGVMKF